MTIILAVASIMAMGACSRVGGKASDEPQAMAQADTTINEAAATKAASIKTGDAAMDAGDAAVEAFLLRLYHRYVFALESRDADFGEIAHCFAPAIQKQLRDGYDYEGEGYAVWLFRTGLQDGPEDTSSVTAIKKEGGGWYRVDFSDMGTRGSCRFKATMRDGSVYISEMENLCKEQQNAIQ